MKTSFLWSVLFILFGTLLFAAEKPNIILFLSDDMGYSDLGCYGSEIRTPNLDTLAEGGIRFTQFYNTARCCPTRASLLTGLHPHEAGMGHMTGSNHGGLPGYRGDLLPTSVTIAEVLKTAGYRNYAIGKWHVTDQTDADGRTDNWPLQRGFDRYYGTIHGAVNYFDPTLLIRDNTPISPFNDPEYQPEKEYYFTTALSAQASRFITEHKKDTPDKPFFLYAAYTAAHWPMQAPEEAVAKYKGQYDAGYEPIRQARYERQKKTGLIKPEWELTEQAGKWDNVENKEWEARCMEVYAAMISELDKGVGQIVETLKKTGQYENTVILFLQDNGACAEEVGRKAEGKYSERPAQAVFPVIPKEAVMKNRRWLEPQTREGYPIVRGKGVLPGPKDTFIAYGKGWANVSNTPFREYKHWVHEGGIATPLIVHSPKYVDASIRGKFERQPGQLPDIMATCIDLAGAAYPKERSGNAVTPAAGTTLVPSFKGQPLNRTLPLVWEHEGNRAIREGKWKLVAKGARGEWELYDVEADRSEQHNLAEKEPDKVKDLAGKWNDWAVKAKVLPSPWTKADDIVADKTPGKKLDFDFSKEQPAADNNTVIKLNDLSGKENVWYVAGKLPVVKQNAGNSAANNGSARYFDGESYIEVSKSSALASAHAAWKAEAEIEADAADGVIIAYGGSRHGYSLFLHGGKPGFAVRLDGEIEIIESEKPISGKTLIQGIITPEKTIELFVNGVKTAGKKISDLLLEEPVESLQIGADIGGSVSGLPLPNFKGKISRITLYREK